jgi:hypothetical protein
LKFLSTPEYYARLVSACPTNCEVAMKRKILLFGALVVVALGLFNCKIQRGIAGSGNRKTEKREVKTFNAIDTSGAYDINITCQKAAGVEIEADDNILPLIKTEVRDGTLFVSNDQEFHSSKTPSLRVTVSDLARLTNQGAGDVKIVDANSNQLDLDSTGAASIEAGGRAKSITISSTGAGKIDAGNLHAEKARVAVSGAASVEVYASDQLDVDISGVGSVSYGGNPKVVNKNVSGIGSVTPKQ